MTRSLSSLTMRRIGYSGANRILNALLIQRQLEGYGRPRFDLECAMNRARESTQLA